MGELPKWFDKDSRSEQNVRSRKHEEKVAKAVGGKRQAGSGSSWRRPQDIISEEYLIQHKYTDKPRFTISVKEWKKLQLDAQQNGREPAMIIDFDEYGITLLVINNEGLISE